MIQLEEALFHAALGKAASEREQFLDEACQENAGLRKRIADLLDAYENPEGFLMRPLNGDRAAARNGEEATIDSMSQEAASASAAQDAQGSPNKNRPGSQIGPYKLLQEIGGGGMGAVWMAEQHQPVRRKVALKFIKPGMDSANVLARFEAERHALALMDHPNIARVLDAGTSDNGRPYFVMELVHGIPLTQYCDEQQLSPRQRLELFVPICQAIQHAHQKGIIHRDIKPSNVLVASYDGRAVPKVIDFGVAKAVGFALTEDTLFTGFGGIVGTLEYMSPEQAEFNALDVDTRSDVYSLGVLLYELLTGTTPLTRQQLKAGGITEALRLIREQDPPRPSARLSESRATLSGVSRQRQTEPGRLARLVRGELDWIVMKTLEKDRSRRYATANDLALDIQRYLTNQTVHACPPSVSYRAEKFFRRHWYGVLTAVALLLVLTVGVVTSTSQAVRARKAELRERQARLAAEANFRLAREAVALGFTKVSESPELKAYGLEPLRKELLGHAKEFYALLVSGQPADPHVRAEEAQTCLRLANITAEMGELVEAARHVRVALATFEELSRNHPDEARFVDGLASALSLSGKCELHDGQLIKCRGALERAVRLRRDLCDQFPGQQQVYKLASALNSLGKFYHWESGQTDQAETTLMEALALSEQLMRDFPDMPEYQNELAHVLQNLGQIYVPRGDHETSLVYAKQSLPLLQHLAKEHPAAPEYQSRLVHTLTAMQVAYHNLRRPKESLAIYEQAHPIAEKLALMHPDVPEYQRVSMQLEVLYGGALSQLGDYARAIDVVEQALQDYESRDALYNAACTYALAAVSVRDNPQLSPEERERLSEHYPQRAMELLLEAEQLGWFFGGSAIESLAADRDLDILRSRDDFQQLLRRVETRSKRGSLPGAES